MVVVVVDIDEGATVISRPVSKVTGSRSFGRGG